VRMAPTEIHLNRRGINSIEAPLAAEVPAGKSLDLVLVNHGHPLHLSVAAANAARFTTFMQQNLFVQGEGSLSIPVKGMPRPVPLTWSHHRLRDAEGGPSGNGHPRCCPEGRGGEASSAATVRSHFPLHRAAPVLIAAGVLLYAAWWILAQPVIEQPVLFSDALLPALLSAAILAWLRPPRPDRGPRGGNGPSAIPRPRSTRWRSWGVSSRGGAGRPHGLCPSSGWRGSSAPSAPRPSSPSRSSWWTGTAPGGSCSSRARSSSRVTFAWRSLEEHTISVVQALDRSTEDGQRQAQRM